MRLRLEWAVTTLALAFFAIAGPALAQHVLAPGEFRDNEIARIRAAHPSAQIAIRDDLGITIALPDDPSVTNVQGSPDNAYHDYRGDAESAVSLICQSGRLVAQSD